MAMGFRPRLGATLQNILPGDQPPVDMGDFTPGQGMTKPKGGFFKEGGMGRYLAGIIGDTLLQQADMAPVFAPMQRQRQALAQEEAQWSRRRGIERQQTREDKLWERDNIPSQGDALERALKASGVIPGTPGWTEAMKRRADNLLNPMMAVQTVDAQGNPAITYTPRNPTGQPAASGVPTVSDEAGYNALAPGAQYRDPSGNLRTKAGGPTQPASGGFSGY